jgi:ABC-2 type transport system ATP-binding protein
MRSQSPALELRSVTKRFDAESVVDRLSFGVSPGRITAFVGANGSGKTTTMRMLLGLVRPSSGQALIDGRRYHELEQPRREVGALLDGPGAHPASTPRRHLGVIATGAGLPTERIDEVLELVQLSAHARRHVGGFSLGMRQRLALAAALLGDPKTLILDEPVNGLDPPGMIWFRDLIRGLADEGRAVLISSHLLGELAEVADRAVIIDRGRLVADAEIADLVAGRAKRVELVCARPEVVADALRTRGATVQADGATLLVEGWTTNDLGDLVAAVDGGPVHRLQELVSSFEDVYLELAGTIERPAAAISEGRP